VGFCNNFFKKLNGLLVPKIKQNPTGLLTARVLVNELLNPNPTRKIIRNSESLIQEGSCGLWVADPYI
jgi:hypothetical protein